MEKYGMKHLLFLVAVMFTLYVLFARREPFDQVNVQNAFSGLKCIGDDLPLVRYVKDDSSFQCISHDGTNCVDRQYLGIPKQYSCYESANNVNKYLSADGIRTVNVDKTTPLAMVYDDFERLSKGDNLSSNIKYFTCTPDGLSNKNHWCGKVWNKIDTAECSKPEVEYNQFANVCKNVRLFVKQPKLGKDVDVTSAEEIADAQLAAVRLTQSTRASNPALLNARVPIPPRRR